MAAALASLTANDVGDSAKGNVRNHHNTTNIISQDTQALAAPPADTAHKLWERLLLRLEEEQLSFDDLPMTEELLWGMLYELGFVSFLERGKLCKRISAKRLEDSTRRCIDKPHEPLPAIA